MVHHLLVGQRRPPAELGVRGHQHPTAHDVVLDADREHLAVVAAVADDQPVEAMVEGEVVEARQA